MKIRILTLLCFIFITGVSNSQTKKSEKVRTSLIKLFELCANDDYEKAARYLVYNGNDTLRRWIDVYNYSNENEKKDIISYCREIKHIIEYGGEFVFKEFKTEKESEGEWCIWQIEFQKGEEKNMYFACLKIKGNYALGDID